METPAGIARLFASQHGLVTRSQALSRGLSTHRIDYLVKSGSWEPLHQAVYRLCGSPMTWHQEVMAACLAAGTGAVASHRAAALLHDLHVAGRFVELTIPKSRRIRTHGVIIHRTGSDGAADRRVIKRIPVTSPPRTIIDLSAVLDLPELEAALDEALSRKIVRPQHLLRRLQSLGGGRKGTRSLRFLLEDRLGVSLPHESQFEAALARLLRRNKLPPPIPQFRVRLSSGRAARLDFAYPEVMLAVEADSYRYHSSLTAWSRDRSRNNELIAMGWRVLPVTFVELRDDPESVAEQIAWCLRSGQVWSDAGT